jgi:tetratricopeptide (TPR) repeat protein
MGSIVVRVPDVGVDVFPADDLVWIVFYEPGTRPAPVVILTGRGAQALGSDEPQLSSILTEIGVRERHLQMHSRHAEALLLHVADEPAKSVAWHYHIARQLVLDLWDKETETPLFERTLKVRGSSWFHRVLGLDKKRPPVARHLRRCPVELFPGRFPKSGEPSRPLDHARWLSAFGRYGKSCAVLARSLEPHPDDAAVHYQLGCLLTNRLQQPQKAVEHLRRASALVPDRAEVWNQLGITLLSLGESIEGCAAFTHEAELADEFGAWMNVAMVSLDNGLTGDARAAANRAKQHDAHDPILLLVLTICARRDKNETEAVSLLRQAEQALQRMPADDRKHIEDAFAKIITEARDDSRRNGA